MQVKSKWEARDDLQIVSVLKMSVKTHASCKWFRFRYILGLLLLLLFSRAGREVQS